MLRAGVPVVLHNGRSCALRLAGSLLHVVGLPQMMCQDMASCGALALSLATARPRRWAVAQPLAGARLTSPLFSNAYLAPQLEAPCNRMRTRDAAASAADHLPAA